MYLIDIILWRVRGSNKEKHVIWKSHLLWSILENYTNSNTRQHVYKTWQHDTTRENTSTTRHNTSKTRDNTSKIWHNKSTSRPNTSTSKAQAAKVGLCFSLFVSEGYIFLIFFRNCQYSSTCNIVLILWKPTTYIYVLRKCY